jgi:hypothetical protein
MAWIRRAKSGFCSCFRQINAVVLLLAVSSTIHGATGAEGTACTGVLISLEFQGQDSRSCGRGEGGALNFNMCWEVVLTAKGAPSDGA